MLATDQVPLYEMETVALAVATLAAYVRDRALDASAEAQAARVANQPAMPEQSEAARRYLNTLVSSELLAGMGSGGWN